LIAVLLDESTVALSLVFFFFFLLLDFLLDPLLLEIFAPLGDDIVA